MEKTKPVISFRSGKIKASVWCEKVQSGEIEFNQYSVAIIKSYKKDGAWHDTTSFFVEDLPRLRLLADEAYKYIVFKKEFSLDDEIAG